jgi:hypothetical protein
VSFASAALLAVAVWLGTPMQAPTTEGDVFEVIAMEDNLDMYENLDFYYWLAQQDQDAS